MRVLLIEDNPGDAHLVKIGLAEAACDREVEVIWVIRLGDALARLDGEAFDVCLLDLTLPDARGAAALQKLRKAAPDLPVVVFTGLDDDRVAMQMLREGGQDYLVKGNVDGDDILRAIRYAQERMRLESDLRQSRLAAERANQAKSVFLANMSHELRSPLNAILGFAEIIMSEMMGPIGTPRYREYAADIHSSGAHLLELINDVLDVSKIEAGKWTLNPEPLDLRTLAAKCLTLVEGRAKDGGLALTADIAADLPPLVADQRATKQCLLNLLTNAVKFTPEGGTVGILARTTPDSILLTVKDSGIGIPASEMPRLLHPFEQVESAMTRKLTGTGLGLSLTKSLVEMHGGSLSIDSREGAGTEVTLAFPRRPAATTLAAPPAGPA